MTMGLEILLIREPGYGAATGTEKTPLFTGKERGTQSRSPIKPLPTQSPTAWENHQLNQSLGQLLFGAPLLLLQTIFWD